MPAPDPSTQKLYRIFCQALAERPLSDRADAVDWPSLSPADWHALPALARREGVAPLLYHTLQRAMYQAPGAVMDALAAEYYRTAAQNTLLLGELDRILAALEQVAIPVIVLKGAALAQTLYPDPALRPMGDLDLLVKRTDLEPAAGLLKGLGYTEVKAEYMGVADWLDQSANHHIHFEGGPTGGLVIELHWNLIAGDVDPRTPNNDWVWEQAIRLVGEAGKQNTTHGDPLFLNRVVHLLYAAAHLMLQHRARDRILIWYYDLDRLVRQFDGESEWDALLAAARSLQWVDALYEALVETQGRFDTPIPAVFLFSLKTHADPVAQQLMAYKTRRTASRTLDNWRNLSTYPLAVRLRLTLALIFPQPAYIHFRYHPQPAWLWPLFYPYRWLDIFFDFLKSLWIVFKNAK